MAMGDKLQMNLENKNLEGMGMGKPIPNEGRHFEKTSTQSNVVNIPSCLKGGRLM